VKHWIDIRDSLLDVDANRSCVALSINIQQRFAGLDEGKGKLLGN
jgi:hypothetical protein